MSLHDAEAGTSRGSFRLTSAFILVPPLASWANGARPGAQSSHLLNGGRVVPNDGMGMMLKAHQYPLLSEEPWGSGFGEKAW